MSQWSFDGVWGKLNRADEHLEALDNRLRDLAQGDAYRARGQLEAEASEYVVRAHIEEFDLLPFGLIFGDAIQNLRIALDHLLCQLVIASGGTPTKQHQFPIYTFEPKDGAAQRWRQMTAGLSGDLLDAVKRVQPYKADETPERRPLAILASFSNADKHRLVLPVVVAVSEQITQAFQPTPNDLRIVGQVKVVVRKPLEHGAEILSFGVQVTGPNPYVDMHGQIPLEIAFGEADAMTPREGIQLVRDHVRMLIEAFESLLRSR